MQTNFKKPTPAVRFLLFASFWSRFQLSTVSNHVLYGEPSCRCFNLLFTQSSNPWWPSPYFSMQISWFFHSFVHQKSSLLVTHLSSEVLSRLAACEACESNAAVLSALPRLLEQTAQNALPKRWWGAIPSANLKWVPFSHGKSAFSIVKQRVYHLWTINGPFSIA